MGSGLSGCWSHRCGATLAMHGTSQSERFIFTVSTGRCGQASLANLLAIHAPYCYAAFEEPQVRPILPGPLRPIERHFRRRFVETHELLGRGRVLQAFDRGDQAFIDRIVARRLKLIRRTMERRRAHIYFDVSKFFARGLHAGFCKAIGRHALVNLVRDPVQNMRSYLIATRTSFSTTIARQPRATSCVSKGPRIPRASSIYGRGSR
jgi:hypothetical protein